MVNNIRTGHAVTIERVVKFGLNSFGTQKGANNNKVVALTPGGLLKKVLYGEALPRGPTLYPFIYHFFRKGTPFVYLLLEKGTPFIYLLMNKLLKQEVFLSFFSRSA